jgi:hypothetical protein
MAGLLRLHINRLFTITRPVNRYGADSFQSVIIPIQTEFLAAVGLVRLIETVDAIREHTNPNLEFSIRL